jgi:hypothetical protein
MTAEFRNSDINRVLVNGNGESIYFALEEKKIDSTRSVAITLGMNRIICSDITIRFKEGKVNNLSFYKKPEARFIPPHEWVEEEKQLKGFVWREKEKPLKEDVVKRPKTAKEFSRKRL